MNRVLIRSYGAALLGTSLFVGAGAFAVIAGTRSAERIRSARVLGVALDEVSIQAMDSIRSPSEKADLTKRREDLENRIRDAEKPALLVAELTEMTRRLGVAAREICPVQSRPDGPARVSVAGYPRIRISVAATYRQLADVLDALKRLRLPVRVTDLGVDRAKAGAGDENTVTADIIVECYQYRPEPMDGSEKQGS